MDIAKEDENKVHALGLAELIYNEIDSKQVMAPAWSKVTVRGHLLAHLEPEIGILLSALVAARSRRKR